MPPPLCSRLLSLCLLAVGVPASGLLWTTVAWAQAPIAQPADLYEGDVLVTSQGAAERAAAAPRALAQVIVKLSGDASAPRNPAVVAQLRDAASLIQQHRYRQDVETAAGAPSYKQYLVASFDRAAVDAIVAAAALPVWPSPRERPVLWLAIDDGRGARLVGGQQVNVVKPLTRRGDERGLGFVLPQGGAAEQAAVDSVWRLDGAALAPLSARYGAGATLLGKLYRADGGWTADWSLLEDGQELSRWSVSDPDARRAIASGADGAADALAEKYAKVVASGPPAVLTVEIRGVRSADDYLRLMGYLQKLAVVRSIVPQQAGPDALRLRLDLATGLEGFSDLVAAGAVLAPAISMGSDPIFELRSAAFSP